jgi:hypothetical protein
MSPESISARLNVRIRLEDSCISTSKLLYVRMEPGPAERLGRLPYQGHARKLYAICLVECQSRKVYPEFTHSQSFETFVRCHIHAFLFMDGIAREHDGNLKRLCKGITSPSLASVSRLAPTISLVKTSPFLLRLRVS